MGEKTAGVGHFAIPTAPAAGTSCTSGAANTFTTTYVQLSASAPAALFITGIYVEQAAVSAATYIVVQLATGTAGSEAIVGQHLIAPVTGSTVARAYKPIYPPIPIANATRIAVKTADSVGALASLITLECINQSNVVDDGVAVATVTTVTNQLTTAQIATGVWQDTTAGDFTTALSVGKSVMNGVSLGTGLTVASVSGSVGSVTGLTASNLDATVSSRMATYTQPTGFLAATFPTTVASPTNITSASGVALAASQHVIVDSGTVTTLTNLPAITAGWLTASGIAAGALNGKGDWLLSSSYTAPDNASITTLTTRLSATRATNLDNLDAAVSSRSTYAGADTSGTTTLLARLTALRAGNLDSLDATVSSRLASASYTAPDNASVATILTRTDVATSTRSSTGDAMALTVAERKAVADALLGRNIAGGADTGRLVKEALAVLRNKVAVVGGVLTVYDADDTTPLFTAAVTTAAGNPISSIVPA